MRSRVLVVNPRSWRVTHAVGRLVALAGGVGIGAVFGVALWLAVTARGFVVDLPPVPSLSEWQATVPTTSHIVAQDGTWLADLPFTEGGAGRRSLLNTADLSPTVVAALLAAEDVRFFSHDGVDARAVLRAAWKNYRAGDVVEGASTIPQQLARGLLPEAIGTERTARRKVREAMLALQLERAWSKPELLTAYANLVFLGNGAYGLAAGARQYFDLSLRDVTVAQAALLAGLIQAPSRFDPTNNPAAAIARRDVIVERMQRAGYIDAPTAAAALATPLELRAPTTRYGEVAPWLTEHARQLIATDDPAALARGRLRLETTADIALDRSITARVRSHTTSLSAGHKAPLQAAAIVWDHRTSYILAMVGGTDWRHSQFNRATQSCRQPGSAWKPIVYAAGLATRTITPGTPLRDAPIAEYDDSTGEHWKPKHGGQFRGFVLAQDAFASSLNPPAIEVFRLVGGAAVVALARRLGITTDLVDVGPLALGASCVRPLELAAVFAHFARGGYGAAPRVVVRAFDGTRELFDHAVPEDPMLDPARRWDRIAALAGTTPGERAGAAPDPALDAASNFLVTQMLRAVVTQGTGVLARVLARPAAGKTGTTNNNTDAWFVGFTARTLGVVWLGFDEITNKLGRGQDGRRAAVPLWVALLSAAEGTRPKESFPDNAPATVRRVAIDPASGLLAAPGGPAKALWFRVGTEPTDAAGAPSAAPSDFSRTGLEF